MDTNTARGVFVANTENSVEMDCLGFNTVTIRPVGLQPGVGDLLVQVKMKHELNETEWFQIPGSSLNRMDEQIPMAMNEDGIYKFPCAGYSKIRVFGSIGSGSAEVYMCATEGVEVVQQVLSYSAVRIKVIKEVDTPIPVEVVVIPEE